MGSREEIKIEDDFYLIRFQNDTNDTQLFQRPVHTDLIQFHYGLKGKAKFVFNDYVYGSFGKNPLTCLSNEFGTGELDEYLKTLVLIFFL